MCILTLIVSGGRWTAVPAGWIAPYRQRGESHLESVVHQELIGQNVSNTQDTFYGLGRLQTSDDRRRDADARSLLRLVEPAIETSQARGPARDDGCYPALEAEDSAVHKGNMIC